MDTVGIAEVICAVGTLVFILVFTEIYIRKNSPAKTRRRDELEYHARKPVPRVWSDFPDLSPEDWDFFRRHEWSVAKAWYDQRVDDQAKKAKEAEEARRTKAAQAEYAARALTTRGTTIMGLNANDIRNMNRNELISLVRQCENGLQYLDKRSELRAQVLAILDVTRDTMRWERQREEELKQYYVDARDMKIKKKGRHHAG